MIVITTVEFELSILRVNQVSWGDYINWCLCPILVNPLVVDAVWNANERSTEVISVFKVGPSRVSEQANSRYFRH